MAFNRTLSSIDQASLDDWFRKELLLFLRTRASQGNGPCSLSEITTALLADLPYCVPSPLNKALRAQLADQSERQTITAIIQQAQKDFLEHRMITLAAGKCQLTLKGKVCHWVMRKIPWL